MSAWVTTARVKTLLGISGSASDAKIDELVPMAQSFLERQIGRTLEQATVTEYQDGNGRSEIVLHRRPVASVTSVHDDLSREWDAETLISATDYAVDLDAGLVRLLNGERGWPLDPLSGVFQAGVLNVRIVYVAGYLAANIPLDIQMLVVDLVAAKINAMPKGGLKSESIGSYSYSLADLDSLAAGSKETLAAWTSLALAR